MTSSPRPLRRAAPTCADQTYAASRSRTAARMATERSFASTTLPSRKKVTSGRRRSASLGLWSSMLNGPRTPPKIFSTASTTAWCSAETSALPVMGLMRGMRSSFREAGFVRRVYPKRDVDRSVDVPAAIHQERLPGDEVTVIGGEEDERAHEVARHLGPFQHPQIDVRLLALGRDVLLVLAAQREE